MANSTIDMYYYSRDSAYMLNSGYGRIYAWGSATITNETPTTVTVGLTVYTCGTPNSDPWRGPSWSGMSIYAGFSGDWGGYQAFSYNYEAVISTYYEKTFTKRADQYIVDLQIDTDGSLPTHFDVFTLGTLTVGQIVSYNVNYYDIDKKLITTLPKYQGTDLTLNCVAPTIAGKTFKGWTDVSGSTEQNPEYANGQIYKADAPLNLYAVYWNDEYIVTYKSSLTDTHNLPSNVSGLTYGNSVTIPSTKPYHSGKKFEGYATSENGTVAYAAGQTFKVTTNLTLWCVWSDLYYKPTVTNLSIDRGVVSNSVFTPTDDGTKLKVAFNFSFCNLTEEYDNTKPIVSAIAITIESRVVGTQTWASRYSNTNYPKTPTATYQVIADGFSFSPDEAYEIRVTLNDGTSSAYATSVVSKAHFIIDIVNRGAGMGIGTSAPQEGLLVAMESKFTENVIIEDDLNDASPNLFNPYPFLEHQDCLGVSDDGTITLAGKKTFTASAAFSDVFPGLKVGKTYRLRAYRMSGTHKINNIIYFTATGSSTASSASYNGTFTVTEAMMAGRVNLYNSAYGVDLTDVPALDIRFAVYADTSKTEYEPYCKRIGIRYGKSEMYMCVPGDIDSPACLYAPKSNASSVGTPLYPFNSVHSKNVYINGNRHGEEKVLWSGVWYMNASQTASLSESISSQIHGIVLVWTSYDASTGEAFNADISYTFIPKSQISLSGFSSNGVDCQVGNYGYNSLCTKYVYISDTSITGHSSNDGDRTSKFVLRYVLGV